MFAFELIDYHIQNIYKNTKWGRITIGPESAKCYTNSVILENRIEFFYDFDIEKYIPINSSDIASFVSYGKNSEFKNFFEVSELYSNKSNEFVLLVSEKNKTSYYMETIFMNKFEFKKIYNMYSTNVNSYVKIGTLADFSLSMDDFISAIV